MALAPVQLKPEAIRKKEKRSKTERTLVPESDPKKKGGGRSIFVREKKRAKKTTTRIRKRERRGRLLGKKREEKENLPRSGRSQKKGGGCGLVFTGEGMAREKGKRKNERHLPSSEDNEKKKKKEGRAPGANPKRRECRGNPKKQPLTEKENYLGSRGGEEKAGS